MTRTVKRRIPARTGSPKMQAFLDSGKRETRLLGPVERHLLSRPPSDRRTDVLHPSEMAKSDWCHLASYHLLSGVVPTPEVIRLQRENIFAEGHEIHAKWQSWLADMGVLVGNWHCIACSRRAAEMTARPAACGWCGKASGLVYREVPLRSAVHRIAGHSDGWVTGLGDDALIEIKSIGTGTIRMEAPKLLAQHGGDLDALWKSIRRPFPSHLRQGQLYLAVAQLAYGSSAPKEIIFIYELKANQAVKEFVVEYNPEVVDHLLDTALDIVWAVEKRRPPVCPNSTSNCAQCGPLAEAAG